MDSARAKKWAKRATIALGGLLLFVALLTTALFIWLGTDSARRMVLGFAESALAEQGLRLEVRETAGQLPFYLDLDGLSLADADGVWLSLDRLHLSLSPFKLVGFVAQLDSLRLEGLELTRLPALPAPAQTDGPANQKGLGSLNFSMPLEVRVNELALLGARVEAGLLYGLSPGLPEKSRDFIGEAIEFSLQASSRIKTNFAEINVESVRLNNQLLMAGLDNALMRLLPGGDKGPKLDFSGSILAQITDEKFFSLLGVEEGGVPLFGKSHLQLALQAKTDLGDEDFAVDFSLKGPLSVESRYELFCGEAPGAMTADIDLAGRFDGVLGLDLLRVAALGLAIDGKARLVPSPLDISLEAAVSGERRGEWNNILQRLSGGIPATGFKAALTASLAQKSKDARLELAARVGVSASEFVWQTKELEKALGTYAAALIDFSGPVVSPYAIVVEGFATGFEPVEPAPYTPGMPLGPSVSSRGKGGIEISIPGVAPLRQLAAHGAEEQSRLTSLNGQVEARVANIGPFVPASEGSVGISGPALASASIVGLAGSGATSLHMEARLVNPAESSIASPLGDLTLVAEAGMDLAVRKGVSMSGSALLNAESSKAGPINLKSGWSVDLPEESGIRLGVKDLYSSFAGLTLTGHAKADLPRDEAANGPALSGRLAAHFENWKGLNEILRRLELDIPALGGTPLDLLVEMEHGKAGQNAALSFNLARLRMPMSLDNPAALLTAGGEKEPPIGSPGLVLLNDIQARVELKDLWGKRLMSAQAQTASGSIDIESWGSAAVYLDLAGSTGRINMAMRGDGAAMSHVRAFDAATPLFTREMVEKYLREGAGNGAEQKRRERQAGMDARQAARAEAGLEDSEMAALAGIFRLNPFAVRLERMAVYAPQFNTGIYLQAPAFISVDDDVIVRDVDFAILPNGFLRADAHFSAEQSRATADIKDLPLALIRALLKIPLPDGELSLTSTMNMRGGQFGGETEISAALRPADSRTLPEAAPQELSLKLKGVLGTNSPEFKLPSRPGLVRLTGSGSIRALEAQMKEGLNLAFDIPFHSDEHGMLKLDSEALLAATLGWKGELARFWAVLPVADRYLNGMGQLDMKLGGSLAKLEYVGSAYLAGARYEDRVDGFMLEDINLEALSSPQGSKLVVAAKDGRDGRLAIEARLDDTGVINTGIGGGAASALPTLTARGEIKHLAPLHRDDLYLRLSGFFDASGPLLAPLVQGKFEVEQGNLNLLAQLGGSVATLPVEVKSEENLPKKTGQSPVLDISVEAPRRFYVRGPGLDSEWQLGATVKGPAANPEFSAVIRPVRGYFDLLSRPFAFSKGQIKVWGNNDYLDSDLDLLLTYSSNSLTAEVSAGGSIKRPSLTLGSTPAMPQDQILAQVIFGKDITQLSAIEALQVANGVRQLMSFGQGGFDLAGELRSLLGVDTLRVGSSARGLNSSNISGSPDASAFGVGSGSDPQAEATPTVEAGKYINDSIYVGVEQGTVENSTRVRVEIELKPNLTLEGSSGGDSSQVGLGWKRDY